MAEPTEGGSDPQVTFKVKTSGDKQHTITMAETATVSDLKNKLAGAEFEDIPIDRQRLIYSGRVMKNEEPLSTYKIKNGNTVHLVKSAASNPTPAPASSSTSSSTPSAPQIPTNMAAGTANNPLAGLTGARYAGLTNLPSADMFGPDGGMVGSMMDEEQLANMLSNPNVAQQMNEMMNNDAFIDMMIQSNPMLRNNPNAREIVRSPLFRHMMTNPDALRGAARLQRAMGGRQAAQNAFPMPGVTDTTPGDLSSSGASDNANSSPGNNQNAGGQYNPFDPASWSNIQVPGAGGGGGGAANPFGAFFNPFAAGQPAQGATSPGAAQATGGAQTESGNTSTDRGQGTSTENPSGQPPNPFASLFGGSGAFPGMGAGAGAGTGAGAGAGAGANPLGNLPPVTPELLQQMVQVLGMGSPSGSPAPPDNRPPEERYAEQLRQLNDMGFYDFDRNVAALRRSGGSVQGAIEHLLNS